MSIYKTAYDTTVGSGFNSTKLRTALEEIAIKECITIKMIESTKGSFYVGILTGGNSVQSQAPAFPHPYLIGGKENESTLFSDFRAVVGSKKSGQWDNISVSNNTEFRFIKLRTVLNTLWLALNPILLRDISPVVGGVYASWISEGISRRFGLDMKEQQQVAIIAAAFYANLFREESVVDRDEDKAKLEAFAIKCTRSPYALVSETIAQIEVLGSIKDLCSTIQTILDNPRLQDLNAGILITMINGAWYGNNNKEVLGVALEHPPTWITIVYYSLLERGYSNSGISRISERYAKTKGGDALIHAVDAIAGEYVNFTDNFIKNK